MVKISVECKADADQILSLIYCTSNNPMKPWENKGLLGLGVTPQDGLELLGNFENLYDFGISIN